MAQIADWTCNICEKPNGKLFCCDCNQNLCDCCKNIHDKFPANTHHTVKEAHLKVLPVSHECAKHKQNFLHYCQTCECLTCSGCITSDHNGHTFIHVKDIADNARKIVSEAICNLKQNQSTMTNMNEEISVIEMSRIQSDTEKFTSKVSHLSQCLKGIIERVVMKQETIAFDFLALGKAQLESYLAKLNKAFEDYSSLCKKLENVLLETHDATFYDNQAKLMTEFDILEIIPPIEKVVDLKEFSDEDFIDNVVDGIQVQHGIRAMQTLSDQLKQEEIIHQETKISLVTEKEKLESSVQSKDNQIKNLSRTLNNEKISHQKTKATVISEQQRFDAYV
ncbi:tripartite motif-containing protein 2/3 [Mytilus galloprovincialis]|uniref:Tripartite motif-containing protein 2/3 n=1 Tax=Mytilus galloprovincialis TaxID=29158 RepID=A0A8B6BRH2_MYTGA|nr:tripartite motif-containing protein 2/3 [Mytilus galloprovincialis]